MKLIDIVTNIEKKEHRRPIIPVSIFPAITFTNSTFKDNYINGNVQFNTLKWALNNFEIDGTRAITDLVVEVEAMGVPIEYPKADTPYVKEAIIKTEQDIYKLHKINPYKDGRLPVILNVITNITDYLKENNIKKYICGSMTGPFTCLGHLVGPSVACIKTIKDPKLLHKLLRLITDSLIEYAKALIKAGADIIWISEPLGCVLSPDQYWEFSSSYCKEIYQSVDNETMTILHVCGNTYPLVENMVKSSAQGLSFDEKVGLQNILNKVPEDVVILGDVPPVITLLQGSSEDVSNYCNSLLNTMMCNYNFILSTGCSIPPKTTLNNIEAFTGSVTKVNAYSKKQTQSLKKLKNSILNKNLNETNLNLKETLNLNIKPEHILSGCVIPAIDYTIQLCKEGKTSVPELMYSIKCSYDCIKKIKNNTNIIPDINLENKNIINYLINANEFNNEKVFKLMQPIINNNF